MNTIYRNLARTAAACAAGAAFMLIATPASAGGHVNWSVNVGVPYVEPVVQAPVYYRPAPVVYAARPAPVYVVDAPPVVEYSYGAPYYYGYHRGPYYEVRYDRYHHPYHYYHHRR